ncbi:MAG: N-acetyl-alpha-D-glucosaminyl L-malate synthase BshA [Planctomycetota bacterium]|jgi:N-acetyl-alpha-D-glucosaminyl L-malate synthase BshA
MTDSKLRVGIICHPTYGGSGVVASELALSLAEAGHVVHLFSHEVPPRLARSSGPVEMHVARGIPYPLFHSTPHDLAITSSILDVHRTEGLDVLHAHYALPHAVSAFLARAASCRDDPSKAMRMVTTLHGTDITLVGNDPSYAPLMQFVIGASDAVTAVSADLAQRTRRSFEQGETKPPCKIEVIPNFVDTELFCPSVRDQHATPTAVHVSNFREVKRVPWLVRAFALAIGDRPAQLVLVGDGPEQQQSREVARELGICDRVTFLGMRDALPELLAPANVFALASSEESFGLSSLEAMACGTPVVSTNVGGVSEVIEEGISGMLTESDDLNGYANNLRQLLFDRELSTHMGQAARKRAEDKFERRHVVGQYETLYRRLISEGSCD